MRVLGRSGGMVGAVLSALLATGANAQTLSSILVDHATGAVLSEERADQPAYPASLTKMMTLYLTFEAMRAGRVSRDSRLRVSPEAAAQPPSKLGLKPGSTIKLDDAIRAVAVKSANDVARVIAENLAGSEPRFAQLMTYRARELGMTRTRFVNASGLPDEEQRTTARDMATLARRLISDFPEYYHYFGLPYFVWRGRTLHNHNRLLATYEGMDGLKTGYTRASGYNLAASAVRDGRRLVAVVLGGSTSAERNREIVRLLDHGFATRPDSAPVPVAAAGAGSSIAAVPDGASGPRGTAEAQRPAGGYAVALGSFRDRRAAVAHARRLAGEVRALRGGEPAVGPAGGRSRRFAAQIVGLTRQDALAACAILRRGKLPCSVVRTHERAIGSD
ncbi:MAG: D-alanyl-D-alanine carboxypeptidase family protein [Geminicoccaceae bacterium]|nr:D-alanyl-D-alanine carboxypeptidase family protein [Geminicoccaceae bacterium]